MVIFGFGLDLWIAVLIPFCCILAASVGLRYRGMESSFDILLFVRSVLCHVVRGVVFVTLIVWIVVWNGNIETISLSLQHELTTASASNLQR